MVFRFELSPIQYSKHDIGRGLKIPSQLTPQLAEFIGIMVGDGHVGLYKSKKDSYGYVHYEILIAGNLKEKSYYTGYVNDLIYTVFGVKFNHRPMKYTNVMGLRFASKALYLFLHDIVGIPQNKNSIRVPVPIMNGDVQIKAAFLRGLRCRFLPDCEAQA